MGFFRLYRHDLDWLLGDEPLYNICVSGVLRTRHYGRPVSDGCRLFRLDYSRPGRFWGIPFHSQYDIGAYLRSYTADRIDICHHFTRISDSADADLRSDLPYQCSPV